VMADDTTDVPFVYVSCARTGDRVDMHGIHRHTGPARPPGPWHPKTPYGGHFTAVLRDASGRALSWESLHPGFVHFMGMPGSGAPHSWSEPSGLYHASLQDHPNAVELAVVEGDRVLWALTRPARPPQLRDVRAMVVAAGDLDHHRAAHYVPEAGMLHVTWRDDCGSAFYEREVRWATPEQPEGAWTGDPLVGDPRGETVVSLGTIPAGDVQVRVRLNDGFHVVDSEAVVVRVPVSRAVAPVRPVRRAET
jgi:hypothetical protein